jgi:hypothetical protein
MKPKDAAVEIDSVIARADATYRKLIERITRSEMPSLGKTLLIKGAKQDWKETVKPLRQMLAELKEK